VKILYLNPDRGIPVLGDKGASVHVREFVTAASAIGHEVTLACARLGEGNPPPPARLLHIAEIDDAASLAGEAAAQGLDPDALEDKITRRELAKLAHDRGLADRVLAELDAAGIVPDLVYERHALFHCAGVALARRLGVPRLLEVNAPLIEEQRRHRDLRLEAVAARAERASYRGATAIVAVSPAVADHVRAVLGRRDGVHVIANGVDVARFADAEAAGAAIRAQLGIGDAPVAGFIGSFKAWHGVAFLLDAVAALAALQPDLHLLAVGDGPEREAVAARAEAHGIADRVILPGRVPHADIPAWLGAMDFTVAPYQPQPDFYFSPLKIFESLAAGRPVIAPGIGPIPGVIADGETGLLYPPGDAVSLRTALAIMTLDRTKRRAMAERARRHLHGRDWRDVVARSLALIAHAASCDCPA
jgi:glycosyltransferase involved in cell wall biosynthesis